MSNRLITKLQESLRVKIIYFLAIFISSALSLTLLRLISLFIILYIISRLLNTVFGVLSRIVLAFLIIVSLNSGLAVIAWVFNVPLTSGLILNVYNIGLLAWLLLNYATPRFWYSLRDFKNVDEWLALALSVVTAIILMIPLGTRPTASTVLPIIAGGGDNSAHLALLNLNDLNKGYSIGLDNRVASYPVSLSYPQGWHFNLAFLKWVVEPASSVQNPGKLMVFFYSFGALWFSLMLFLMVRLALGLRQTRKNIAPGLSGIGGVIVCAAIAAAYLLPLFVSGFQTQIAGLSLLLGELCFLIMAYQKSGSERYPYFLLAGLTVAGLTLMWQFLTIVAAPILVLCVLQTMLTTTKRPPLGFIIIGAGLAWVTLFQFMIQVAYELPTAFKTVSTINLPGFIPHVAMYPLITAFIIITTYLYLRWANLRLRLVYIFALAALIFSLILMAYQLQTIGELRYYYFKSTYTYIVFAAILIGGICTELVASLLGTKPRFGSSWGKRLHNVLLFTVVAIVGSVVFWSVKSIAFDDVINSRVRGVSPGQATAIATTVKENPSNGYLFVPLGSCNRGDDIRAMLFAHALAYSPLNKNPLIASFELEPIDKDRLFKEINQFLEIHQVKLTIASSDLALSQELTELLGDNVQYVNFINIDTTDETEPQSQCTDRIRTLTPEERKNTLTP